jgi:hypothetical protein
MPHPSHRLDLAIVDDKSGALEALWSALVDVGVIDSVGGPGPGAAAFCQGFERMRIDRPGGFVLYANQQGGFRVACPVTGANLVPEFQRAWSAFQAGGARSLACGCGATHLLDDLAFAPPAAIGTGALVIADVGAAALGPEGAALVAGYLRSVRIVAMRVGR